MSNGAAAIAKVGLNTLVDREIYVLAVQVKTIGDTPLVNHEVRILDPDTGEMVGSPVMTDDEGVVRALVPENKTYRIEILDEENEAPPLPGLPDEEHAVLACQFVDAEGKPIAGENVQVSYGEDCFDLLTDENGLIECPTSLAAYEVTIREQTFTAHALLLADREMAEKETLYRFVVMEVAS